MSGVPYLAAQTATQQAFALHGNAWTRNIISHFALTHRMTNSQRLAKVRSRLIRWITEHRTDQGTKEHGTADNSVSDSMILREAILIRNEFFCGRRFFTSDHFAIWFIEEDELKIYQNNGELLCVLSGPELEEDHELNPSHSRPDILKLPNLDVPISGSSDSGRRAA